MLNVVVAHPSEARPIVARYNLRPENGAVPYPLYRSESLSLIVSGPGKTAAAGAAAYLFGAGGGRRDGGWVNVGMAGHVDLDIGRGVLAHKVIDDGSGQCWYPPVVVETACPTSVVLTVERLEEDYEGERLYDTEAAGFFAAASHFATSELVHGFKIVIDNHGATLGEKFAREVMEDLVASKLGLLDGLFDELRRTAELVRQRRAQGGARTVLGER
jgi:hypothetical protein